MEFGRFPVYCICFIWYYHNGWLQNGCCNMFETKDKPFFIFIHCVAHRTNFVILDVIKIHVCKEVFKYMDKVVNDVATYFKKSSKVSLHALEIELNNSQNSVKKYLKIR